MSSTKDQRKTKTNTRGGQAKQAKQKQEKKKSPIVQAPAASARTMYTTSAKIVQNASSIRIKHRELLMSLGGTANFLVNQRQLNPGLPATFPWLSGISNSWEEYCFHKCDVVSYPRCGTNTGGSLLIAPDYDSTDSNPGSETIASSYSGAVEDAPWKEIRCKLVPSAMRGGMSRKFIRSLALAPNQDIKTYDSGVVFICTTDGTDATPWSKVWIEYDVELFVPALHSTGTMFGGSVTTPGGVGVTASNPLGTAPVLNALSHGLQLIAGTPSRVVAQVPGVYSGTLHHIGSGLTGIAAPTTDSGSITGNLAGIGSGATSLLNTFNWTAGEGASLTLGSLTGTTFGSSSLEIVRALNGILV